MSRQAVLSGAQSSGRGRQVGGSYRVFGALAEGAPTSQGFFSLVRWGFTLRYLPVMSVTK